MKVVEEIKKNNSYETTERHFDNGVIFYCEKLNGNIVSEYFRRRVDFFVKNERFKYKNRLSSKFYYAPSFSKLYDKMYSENDPRNSLTNHFIFKGLISTLDDRWWEYPDLADRMINKSFYYDESSKTAYALNSRYPLPCWKLHYMSSFGPGYIKLIEQEVSEDNRFIVSSYERNDRTYLNGLFFKSNDETNLEIEKLGSSNDPWEIKMKRFVDNKKKSINDKFNLLKDIIT